ncbi:sugar phosphate isomerase/epimerase family protein [Cohnella faecalis]|uniref:Sugar phosphate isomerase/epimerase n=1 Tax=Cohnella faecalis TaxID=2315694 RepID=A0A398CL96_9BACL|nr:sugar phosphate isomerase/epimerase [Cohnella faecalis]RIE00411.1 sugar phosphate isomerase/epimerase [Cohnella faecalis]
MNSKGYSSAHYGFLHEYERLNGTSIPMEVLVRKIAESGVRAFESDPTDELVSLAKEHGLHISAAYIGLNLHETADSLQLDNKLLPLLERMARHEVPTLLLNADPKGGWSSPEVKTEDELKQQGENIARVDQIAKAHGIECCFHNHGATKPLAEGDLRSVTEFDGKEVKLCIDTGWAHVAGYDPIEWIRTYSDRVSAVHLRNQRGPVPSVQFDEGELNAAQLLSALREIGYSGWLTFELYHMAETMSALSVAEATKRSAAFVENFYRNHHA